MNASENWQRTAGESRADFLAALAGQTQGTVNDGVNKGGDRSLSEQVVRGPLMNPNEIMQSFARDAGNLLAFVSSRRVPPLALYRCAYHSERTMRCSAASMTKSPASRSPAPRRRNARRATGPLDRILQRKQAVKSARLEEWESPIRPLQVPICQRNPDARQAWRTRSSASGNSSSSFLCATTGRGWTGHRRSSPKRCSSWRSRRLTGCRAVSASTACCGA